MSFSQIQPRPHSKSALMIGWNTRRTVLWLVAFVLITRIHSLYLWKGMIFGLWLLKFCEENVSITNSLEFRMMVSKECAYLGDNLDEDIIFNGKLVENCFSNIDSSQFRLFCSSTRNYFYWLGLWIYQGFRSVGKLNT